MTDMFGSSNVNLSNDLNKIEIKVDCISAVLDPNTLVSIIINQ